MFIHTFIQRHGPWKYTRASGCKSLLYINDQSKEIYTKQKKSRGLIYYSVQFVDGCYKNYCYREI